VRASRIGVLTAVMSVICACAPTSGKDSGDGAHRPGTISSAPAQTPETFAPVLSRSSAAGVRRVSSGCATLQRLTVARGPADFHLVPSLGGPACSNVAETGQSAAARGYLRHDGFMAGFERLWIDGHNDDVGVALFQFATGEGAAHYARQALRAFRSTGSVSAAFTVSGMPGASGMTFAAARSHVRAELVGSNGRYVLQVEAIDVSSGAAIARTTAFAKREDTLL
jgi:hypothetical protein